MDEFSWSRIGKAFAEAVGYAEGIRSMVIRVLAWLALLGFPLAAGTFLPETILPQSPYGTALWIISILTALGLSVRAIYAKQREADVLADKENRERLRQRRAVWANIQNLALEYESLRRSLLRRPRSPRGAEPYHRSAVEARQRLTTAVGAYWDAVNLLPIYEVSIHATMVGQLRTVLEVQQGPNLARRLEGPVTEVRDFQLWQLRWMDRVMGEAEEARLLHAYLKTMRQVRP